MSSFSIKQDNELTAKGSHFWCKACVVARPISEQSPDPCYCRQCFKLLTFEASLLRGHDNKSAWIPKVPKAVATSATATRHGASAPSVSVLQTDSASGMIKRTGGNFVPTKRHAGRPKRAIPVGRVAALKGQGLSSRDIAKQLAFEGATVSYRTVSRWMVEVEN